MEAFREQLASTSGAASGQTRAKLTRPGAEHDCNDYDQARATRVQYI